MHGPSVLLAVVLVAFFCTVALALGVLTVRLFQVSPDADVATIRRAVMAETLFWRLFTLSAVAVLIDIVVRVARVYLT